MKIIKVSGLVSLVASTLAGVGCGGLPGDQLGGLDAVVSASQQRNDQELNGARVNGARINGARVNGARVNGPEAGAAFSIDSSTGPLHVTSLETGRKISGGDLVGEQFWVELPDGTLTRVVLTGYQAIAAPQVTLDAYVVVSADTSQSICGYDTSGAAVPAVRQNILQQVACQHAQGNGDGIAFPTVLAQVGRNGDGIAFPTVLAQVGQARTVGKAIPSLSSRRSGWGS